MLRSTRSKLKKITHWLLFAVTLLYLLSGFGVTQYRIVSAVTFGVLHKALSQRIHDVLWIPFCILLIAHIFLTVHWRRGKPSRRTRSP